MDNSKANIHVIKDISWRVGVKRLGSLHVAFTQALSLTRGRYHWSQIGVSSMPTTMSAARVRYPQAAVQHAISCRQPSGKKEKKEQNKKRKATKPPASHLARPKYKAQGKSVSQGGVNPICPCGDTPGQDQEGNTDMSVFFRTFLGR